MESIRPGFLGRGEAALKKGMSTEELRRIKKLFSNQEVTRPGIWSGEKHLVWDRCAIGSKLPFFSYFRDGKLNLIVGVYIPVIRIPVIKGGMTIPNIIRRLDPGTECLFF